jgi:hypothetical protein
MTVGGRWLIGAWLLAACAEGEPSSESRGSWNHSGDVVCEDADDAGTALGVSGDELARAYSGRFTTTVRRTRLTTDKLARLRPTELTITIEPSAERVPHAEECSVLVVAVRVILESEEADLDEELIGELIWNDEGAYVNFSSYFTRGNRAPQVSGSLSFVPGDEAILLGFVVRGTKSQTSFSSVEEEQP